MLPRSAGVGGVNGKTLTFSSFNWRHAGQMSPFGDGNGRDGQDRSTN